MPGKEPTEEELLAIAKEALQTPINDYYKANIEQTAQAVVDGTSPGGEKWNLALIKMMLMTSYRAREIRAAKT